MQFIASRKWALELGDIQGFLNLVHSQIYIVPSMLTSILEEFPMSRVNQSLKL